LGLGVRPPQAVLSPVLWIGHHRHLSSLFCQRPGWRFPAARSWYHCPYDACRRASACASFREFVPYRSQPPSVRETTISSRTHRLCP
jgi:hypothetical protein